MGGTHPEVISAGLGKPGYCTLCNFKDQRALDKKILDGWSARQVNDWLGANFGLSVHRQTVYAHKRHVMHPADRLVTAQRRREVEHGTLPQQVSTAEYLEAVKGAAMQRVIDDPGSVTVEHGLKAASILTQTREKTDNVVIVLAKLLTGHAALPALSGQAALPMIVEGQSRPVEVS